MPGVGIYVILAPDVRWTPRQFRPIYFGETGDFSARVNKSHERFDDWQRETTQLYVAQMFMTGSTKQLRLDIENALTDWYTPSCNRTGFAAVSGSYGLPYFPLAAVTPAPLVLTPPPRLLPFLGSAVTPRALPPPRLSWVPLPPSPPTGFGVLPRIATTPQPASPRITYVIFDGDNDMYAYRFMRGWKAREHIDVDFDDA